MMGIIAFCSLCLVLLLVSKENLEKGNTANEGNTQNHEKESTKDNQKTNEESQSLKAPCEVPKDVSKGRPKPKDKINKKVQPSSKGPQRPKKPSESPISQAYLAMEAKKKLFYNQFMRFAGLGKKVTAKLVECISLIFVVSLPLWVIVCYQHANFRWFFAFLGFMMFMHYITENETNEEPKVSLCFGANMEDMIVGKKPLRRKKYQPDYIIEKDNVSIRFGPNIEAMVKKKLKK